MILMVFLSSRYTTPRVLAPSLRSARRHPFSRACLSISGVSSTLAICSSVIRRSDIRFRAWSVYSNPLFLAYKSNFLRFHQSIDIIYRSSILSAAKPVENSVRLPPDMLTSQLQFRKSMQILLTIDLANGSIILFRYMALIAFSKAVSPNFARVIADIQRNVITFPVSFSNYTRFCDDGQAVFFASSLTVGCR